MRKWIGVLVFGAAVVTGAGLASLSPTPVEGAGACVAKDFKTEMTKNACAKGGQNAAKDAWKSWMKEKKIKSCNQCHSKLAPNYEQKAGALEQFKKHGGKVTGAGASSK